ncbi:hypothetical protein ABL840_26955 [Variovorax sp. NFACC27]|uniref:hypothetical protein n=1 Tax=unclassified Variovorax TaxID=663243 RepID=UPI00089B73F8|nr:hypothetical protein SAMN03159371_03658 [Variovorax sp. NFACC28]SEG77808.1 hypothetical protein SAMN03159365_03737 [Variovorax sp. NFACC29]SFC96802.1 hypothetical protein SAMN03159379_03685 [Variovorax sp. NFACC26]SFG09737.1 hypothetical protein SAMN03159447_01794 [Variovorax sp. NFACC27]
MAPPEFVRATPLRVHRVSPVADVAQKSPQGDTRELPILFSAPMVRALLDGTKTQTRRVMKRQKQHAFTDYTLFGQRGHPDDEAARRGGWAQPWVAIEHAPDWPDGKQDQCHCPYARKRGDRLWVRETHFAFGRWETRYSAKKRRDEWHFVDMTVECGKTYLYGADHPHPQPLAGKRDGGVTPKWWKRPAIFMPRAASRIDLEITDLRVQRLQDISEEDAIAEGAQLHDGLGVGHTGYRHDGHDGFVWATAKASYMRLWEQINGPDSWTLNPWVWAVTFRRVFAGDSSSITTKENT